MKKLVMAVVLALGLCVFAALPASAESSAREAEIAYRNIKIVIDGQEICPRDAAGNEVEPFILDGTTYLPVRAVADALGLEVRWRDSDSTVLLTGNEDEFFLVTSVDLPPEPPRVAESAHGHSGVERVKLSYRGIRLLVDGVVIEPKDAAGNAVEPFILNGTTYLPVRAVADALGLAVDWDAAASTVRLSHWLEAKFHMEVGDSGEEQYQYNDEYEYDSLGRLTCHNYWDYTEGGRIHLFYDEAGRLVEYSVTDSRSDKRIWSSDTVYIYSGESELCVSAEIKSGYPFESELRTGSAKYEYDGLGRLVRAEESLYGAWAEWSYDEAGRVTEIREKDPDMQGEVRVRKYTYDEYGRLVEIDNSASFSERRTYDEDGRMLSGTTWFKTDLSIWDVTKRYDENGRLTHEEYAYDGELDSTVDYSYDECGRLIREDYVPVGDEDNYRSVEVYTYDGNGNVIRRELTDTFGTSIMTYEYVKAGG